MPKFLDNIEFWTQGYEKEEIEIASKTITLNEDTDRETTFIVPGTIIELPQENPEQKIITDISRDIIKEKEIGVYQITKLTESGMNIIIDKIDEGVTLLDKEGIVNLVREHDSEIDALQQFDDNHDNIENSIGDGSLYSPTGNDDEDTRANGKQAIAFGKGCIAEGSRSLSMQRGNRVSEYITGYVYDASGAKILDSYLSGSTYSYATYDPQTGYTPTTDTLDDNKKETLFTTMGGGTGANACAAFGQLQQVAGNCSAAFGKQNKIYVNGVQSFIAGLRNRLDSYQSSVFGRDNNAIGGRYDQHIIGENNTASGDHEYLIGCGLKSSKTYQTVVGKFNKEVDGALFIVGGGTGDEESKRLNLFYVKHDGAYTKDGKLSNASNLKDGTAQGSLVGLHYNNANANTATGVASIAGGSQNGQWQNDGQNTNVSGASSIGWGYHVNISQNYCYGFGWGIDIKTNQFKLATGYFNEDKLNSLFEVGNGTPTSRKNVFEVMNDGTARALGTPKANNDVLRWQEKVALETDINNALNTAKSYTDSEISNLDVRSSSYSDGGVTEVVSAVTQTNGKISVVRSPIRVGSIKSGDGGFVKGGDVFDALDDKADKDTTYTQSEIDTKLNNIIQVNEDGGTNTGFEVLNTNTYTRLTWDCGNEERKMCAVSGWIRAKVKYTASGGTTVKTSTVLLSINDSAVANTPTANSSGYITTVDFGPGGSDQDLHPITVRKVVGFANGILTIELGSSYPRYLDKTPIDSTSSQSMNIYEIETYNLHAVAL